ncbi:MAG: V-type ATP synthase subunit F [Deltaproteobacteria bacterium]|nr:V-type ATP synthase subunit F [Deltaproteobacteria bacterium]
MDRDMSKLLVITYPDTSLGFKLAGVEVKEVEEGGDITAVLNDIIKTGEYGLLVVEERFLAKVDEGILKRIRKTGVPVIVPIDTPKSWQTEAEMESYVARLIRRAIGYQVKIKR